MLSDTHSCFSSPSSTLALVRGLYDMRGSQEEWEARTRRLIYDWAGLGNGGLNYPYLIEGEDVRIVGDVSVVDGSNDWKELVEVFLIKQPKEKRIASHMCGFSSGLQQFGDEFWHSVAPPEFPDGLAVQSLEKTDTGCKGQMSFFPSKRVLSLNSEETKLGMMATAHLNAAVRLRDSLEMVDALDSATLILESNGKVVHRSSLEGSDSSTSLNALRQQAMLVDSENTSVKNDPGAALRAWTALVNGQWSLIEHFDTDGRRFLIAVDNAGELAGPSKLSAHERAVVACVALGFSNKETAYRLGFDPATTSRLVARAARKMGLSGRLAIARALGPLAMGADLVAAGPDD